MSSKQVSDLSDEELANQSQEWKNWNLVYACQTSDLAAVKRLVAAKADVGYTDGFDRDPLHWAIWSNYLPIVEYLLTHGAKIKMVGLVAIMRLRGYECYFRQTAYHILKPILTFSSGGVTITMKTAAVMAILQEKHLVTALDYDSFYVVQILINAGAKVKEKHLVNAVRSSNLDAVQALINAGAKVTDAAVRKSEQVISEIMTEIFYYLDHKDIVKAYQVHEVMTRKTTQEVLAKMERDKTEIRNNRSEFRYVSKQELLENYKKAIKYYKQQIQHQISGVKLTAAEQIQLQQIFAAGSEKDVYVRVNFVGHTTAGKTSLMLQMFRRKFNPEDIKSTNGIDILLGHCIIDLQTNVWEQYEGKPDDEILERIKEMTMVTKTDTSEKEERRYDKGIAVENEEKVEYIYERATSEATEHRRKETTSSHIETLSKPADLLKGKKSTGLRSRIAAFLTRKKTVVKKDHLSSRIKQASSISGRRKDQAVARGFDYAGQASFYALHQLFLSRRGINIIVLDASRNFKEAIKEDDDVRHIGGDLIGNSIDFFKYWSKMLRYYLPARRTTQIIAVFTHKDLVDKQDELLDKIHQIQTIIKEMGMSGMFYEEIFCVNANDPLDKELQQLRDVILGLSKQLDYWGQKMPSTWLLLEDKLMTKKTEGIRVMKLTEVEKLNEESSPKLESRSELFLFLKVHHEVGTLIHFADEGLQNVVILDAQWLVDSFKTIISAKQFRDPKYKEQWNRLHEKGIVDKEFIYSVWEHNQQDRFYEFREELVRLMNSMDLICSPRKYDKEGQHIVSSYFMVPSMLHKAPVGFIEEYQRQATQINHALVFEFDFDFLPSATVYRLLATCIMQYGDTDYRRVLVYCDAAVFRVYESHFLTLEITNSSIIANILVIKESKVNVGVSQGVREFLEDSLKCITTAQRTTAIYELSVACDKSRRSSSCLRWDELLEQSKVPRESNDNDPTFSQNFALILEEWIVMKELEKKDTQISRSDQLIIPEDKPTPYSLGRISRRISPKGFRELFLELGLEDHVIDEKECQSPKSYRKVVLLLLIEWSRNPNSTFKMLANALFEYSQYILSIEEIHVTSNKWRKDISSKALAGTLLKATDAELDQLCTMTGSKYLELGLELGLKIEEIEIFEEDLKYCQLITRKVLDTWIKEQRSNATLLVLGDALYEIGCDVKFISKVI